MIAARLSEDLSCEVALIEAGDRPPAIESMPAACSALQVDPATDWMYTADAGGAGLGLRDGRMMVPRGKMLGGSSGLNYLAYVRGHPGDFDSWAAQGATGWSYDEVLPLFKKSEGLSPSGDIKVDPEAHSTEGPLGVSVRAPVISGAQEFVDAAAAAGIPTGDYNGRDHGGNTGVASLLQTTTRNGKRSSTYHAFVEGEAEHRPNLTIITRAHATRLILDGDASAQVARGVQYRTGNGEIATAIARKEVVLSAGAVGSPQLLLLSGIGPKGELEATGVPCRLDLPEVGKHLKDHLQVALFFPAPGVGVDHDRREGGRADRRLPWRASRRVRGIPRVETRVAGRSVVEPRTRLESSTEISMADEVEPVIGHQGLPCDNHEAGHGWLRQRVIGLPVAMPPVRCRTLNTRVIRVAPVFLCHALGWC